MVNYVDSLDDVYFALSNQTRRGMIDILSAGRSSLSELARRLSLSLPALHKHTRVLEQAKLVNKRKEGRVTYLALKPGSLETAEQWITAHQKLWEGNLDSLEKFINNRRANNG